MKLKTKVEVCGWLILTGIVGYGLKYFISLLGDFAVFRNALALLVMFMIIVLALGSDNVTDKVKSVA